VTGARPSACASSASGWRRDRGALAPSTPQPFERMSLGANALSVARSSCPQVSGLVYLTRAAPGAPEQPRGRGYFDAASAEGKPRHNLEFADAPGIVWPEQPGGSCACAG
jgi:hypothetical protein